MCHLGLDPYCTPLTQPLHLRPPSLQPSLYLIFIGPVSGWHSLRGLADRHGQSLSPQYVSWLVKEHGVRSLCCTRHCCTGSIKPKVVRHTQAFRAAHARQRPSRRRPLADLY